VICCSCICHAIHTETSVVALHSVGETYAGRVGVSPGESWQTDGRMDERTNRQTPGQCFAAFCYGSDQRIKQRLVHSTWTELNWISLTGVCALWTLPLESMCLELQFVNSTSSSSVKFSFMYREQTLRQQNSVGNYLLHVGGSRATWKQHTRIATCIQMFRWTCLIPACLPQPYSGL